MLISSLLMLSRLPILVCLLEVDFPRSGPVVQLTDSWRRLAFRAALHLMKDGPISPLSVYVLVLLPAEDMLGTCTRIGSIFVYFFSKFSMTQPFLPVKFPDPTVFSIVVPSGLTIVEQ